MSELRIKNRSERDFFHFYSTQMSLKLAIYEVGCFCLLIKILGIWRITFMLFKGAVSATPLFVFTSGDAISSIPRNQH